MWFSKSEITSIRLCVEPIAKAMAEKNFDSIPTLRPQLVNAISNLRPQIKKNYVEDMVAAAVRSPTVSVIDTTPVIAQGFVEIECLVVAIIERLNILFQEIVIREGIHSAPVQIKVKSKTKDTGLKNMRIMIA